MAILNQSGYHPDHYSDPAIWEGYALAAQSSCILVPSPGMLLLNSKRVQQRLFACSLDPSLADRDFFPAKALEPLRAMAGTFAPQHWLKETSADVVGPALRDMDIITRRERGETVETGDRVPIEYVLKPVSREGGGHLLWGQEVVDVLAALYPEVWRQMGHADILEEDGERARIELLCEDAGALSKQVFVLMKVIQSKRVPLVLLPVHDKRQSPDGPRPSPFHAQCTAEIGVYTGFLASHPSGPGGDRTLLSGPHHRGLLCRVKPLDVREAGISLGTGALAAMRMVE
ncbi:glutathione synthase, eukaryotic [Kipferlia bialata]|uniref:Glutathione synthase, eukaryotic n=1 Tax=Kipferlia bialata TaxID=797122 RepID=A0A9K3GG82_9EUKA|nr:glutathione synthase, eukaryotic [Kipferlia bialata]GIQ82412.1 glutathione synthase, eukaryotic [Kipferlia bialata]|eukprot:g2425.t1